MVLLASQIFEECFKSEGILVFLGWKNVYMHYQYRKKKAVAKKKILDIWLGKYAVSLWYQR